MGNVAARQAGALAPKNISTPLPILRGMLLGMKKKGHFDFA